MTTTSTGLALTIADQDQLAAALEDQRRFRIEQIAYLAAVESHLSATAGEVDREVRAILLDGARSALARVTAAGQRLARGDYGRCVACTAIIPADELLAVPEVPACADCRRAVGPGQAT